MTTEIRVPTLGESVSEATVGQWFKAIGESVRPDEPLVEIETDKVTVEVPAPAGGVIELIAAKSGETVGIGALLGTIAAAKATNGAGDGAKPKAGARAEAKATAASTQPAGKVAEAAASSVAASTAVLSPSVRKLVAEKGLDPAEIQGNAKGGRLAKADVLAFVAAPPPKAETKTPAAEIRQPVGGDDAAREERVHMTRLRQTIARRLKEAQNTAAMLTTFNEVDMSAIIGLRAEYKDLFEKKHGVKLGFMGFFVRAVVQALKDIPAVNAEVDGTDLVYKNYYHIGVAVGTDRGLVVPVVREADRLTLAEIEKTIGELGRKARDGQLAIDDMQGGTFTISNGGVYGSLMSTPILNAPQSGILGMHKIQERPVVAAGKIEARPMMYLALSYDHQIVDGREAVTFLVRIKELIEAPQRLMLDL